MTTIKRTKKERIAELLASNNALLERARKAEDEVAQLRKDFLMMHGEWKAAINPEQSQQAIRDANDVEALWERIRKAARMVADVESTGSNKILTIGLKFLFEPLPPRYLADPRTKTPTWEKKPDDPEWWWNGYMIGQWGNMKRTEHFNCFRPNSMVAFAQATTLAAAQRLCEDDAQTNAK